MKIIVTCGPSYEPIDEVRRITNFSTGRLGITLANAFVSAGWEVVCLKGEQSTCPDALRGPQSVSFSTNQDLADQLCKLSRGGEVAAVFHAAALCDFRVRQVTNGHDEPCVSPKFSTREGELRLILTPTVKVLPQLRGWFPEARLVGWKYELGGTLQEAFSKATRQIEESGTDACVLNGAAYGAGFAFCERAGIVTRLPDLAGMTEHLVNWMRTPNLAC